MHESIIEPIGIPEFFTDGFGDYTMRNGILRCVGFSLVKGKKLGVLRLVIAGEGAVAAVELTKAALNGEQRPAPMMKANARSH